ncbi:hypothetical protein CHS0354_037714 [Potamilus streckersoni]|uniref:Uncharacterized protein n=1 Tax=Potamilus streckersoni TaxID=2493646 RepID=A0AAE0W451_9BIVA|nr:hypothetical protein CHS0354_037714 [Potamilus streckersoni]
MATTKTRKRKPLSWLNVTRCNVNQLDPNGELAESTHFLSELRPRPEDVNIKGDVKTKFGTLVSYYLVTRFIKLPVYVTFMRKDTSLFIDLNNRLLKLHI